MNRDFIWEGDYGNRSHLIPILKEILEKQNANSLQMVNTFINNNPYTLEFYLVLSYDRPEEQHIAEMIAMLQNADLIYRPDITYNELFSEFGNRRFISSTFVNGRDLEIRFLYLFDFVEKKELREKGCKFSGPLGRDMPVFLSHQSKNKEVIEELIPYLNGEGLPIWFDKYNIDYGESIVDEVEKGIKNSGAVVFWITKDFIESDWCKKELKDFLNRYNDKDILIIPVISDDIDIEELNSISDLKYIKNTNEELNIIAKNIVPRIKKFYNENFKR
ncbi:toll/interleukin-1 receptor domain-containing protein [Lysinibacillus fusiformis]|uniref:TIR domain protein n=1 Tax=Lysinibacillus fusiformis TaxID=28031 RepID=A0A2I0UWI4_9BACI|nr:toll/interleukin-1 receptor domain-containing protein [Lysinibacillus fusiformis]PKU50444.1 TIR domain protein [Lysinibacillus fusiformis]